MSLHVNPLLNVKDSRWLQLEVCREFQRNKCTRSDSECKFAHPGTNVEIQNGRVIACYDSIKGRCNREKPPCKYFHPPKHLKEQLIINGKNHLALKNALLHHQVPFQTVLTGQLPMVGSIASSNLLNAYQRTNLFNQQQQQHPQPFSTTIPVPHNNISSSLMINGSAANINNNNNPMAAFTNASQLNGSLIIPNCTLSAKAPNPYLSNLSAIAAASSAAYGAYTTTPAAAAAAAAAMLMAPDQFGSYGSLTSPPPPPQQQQQQISTSTTTATTSSSSNNNNHMITMNNVNANKIRAAAAAAAACAAAASTSSGVNGGSGVDSQNGTATNNTASLEPSPTHVLTTDVNASTINHAAAAAAAVANIAAVAAVANTGRKRTRESNDELLMQISGAYPMTKRTALDKNGTPSLFHHHNIGHHQLAPLSLTHPNSTAAAAAAYAAAANNHHHHYHQQPQHLQYPQHQAFAMPQPLVPLSFYFPLLNQANQIPRY
ncbi:uncharacterized protein LOC113790323 isoform X2 [Dermatophagoides pteronyssinus]|uniref:uncharacterized protein LOC113790323 isoform X2 n=1 Tax=Dermatophagoides pteronyssinus TaxID=6956 RepID=UPI003F66988F